MTISFNQIPTTIRTPGALAEIDNSKAVTGLVPNPHKVLIIGDKITAGTIPLATLAAITKDNLADGYFGQGSVLARMLNVFKNNNPNTEVYGMALSGGTAVASGRISFTSDLSVSGDCTLYLMINGTKVYVPLTSAWSNPDIVSEVAAKINGSDYSFLPVIASVSAASVSNELFLMAVNSGTVGNYIDFRLNYYTGESNPLGYSDADINIEGMAGGAGDPDLGDAWPVIANERFNYIITPNIDTANLTEIEDELATRFGPQIGLQGHAFTAVRGAVASCTTLGNSRNSPHGTMPGCYDSPTDPAEWAAAWGAQAAYNLNVDPARPLHYLKLKGILAPPMASRFTQAERNTLLFDGIATYIVDSGGNVLIERSITTYQKNVGGLPDPSYLDIQTLATAGEIRDQFLARMINRFIAPRFKLADDTFPVQPGSKIATPGTIKQEIIALFTLLRNNGLIENLQEFVDNLIVERSTTDVNRVDVLLPPDFINQFRLLAGTIQFIL